MTLCQNWLIKIKLFVTSRIRIILEGKKYSQTLDKTHMQLNWKRPNLENDY